MNKKEFLDNLDRLETARKQAKKDYDSFVDNMDKDERLMKKAYIAEHAPFKLGELVVYNDWNEKVVDTIYDIKLRVVTTASANEPTICFDYYRTGNNNSAIDKERIEKIADKVQEQLRDEAMKKAVCKVGDDVMYYRSQYKVIGIYARSYKGEIYPVYRMRNAGSSYVMFATTRDFKTGTCTVVNTEKVVDCQGIAI